MTTSHIRNFLNGFVGAAQLLQRAAENGFFVEYVCLAASVIDGSLRVGLILQRQLLGQHEELPRELLLQADGDPIVTEREIFRKAHAEGVIDQALFDRLSGLYDKRNRVVHRYIISELTTRQVLEIASEFEQVIPLVNAAVSAVEAKQEELGIGMVRGGEFPGFGSAMGEMSAEKHGDSLLAKLLKNGAA